MSFAASRQAPVACSHSETQSVLSTPISTSMSAGGALSKRISAKHSPEQLRAMQMEYELEASALLALRHAADAYRKSRPELA